MNSFLIFLVIYTCLSFNSMPDIAVAENEVELDSHRRARYSYFWTIEYYCTDKCRRNGKPYGRLIGTVCRCFCPQVDEVDYCTLAADISCSFYCKKQGYSTGDCIYQNKCFCFCRPGQPYPPCPGNNPIPEYVEFAPKNCPKVNSTHDTEDAGNLQNATDETDDKSGTSATTTITTESEVGYKPVASNQTPPAHGHEEPSTSAKSFSYLFTLLSNIWQFSWSNVISGFKLS